MQFGFKIVISCIHEDPVIKCMVGTLIAQKVSWHQICSEATTLLCRIRLWGIKSKVFASLSAAGLDIRPLAHYQNFPQSGEWQAGPFSVSTRSQGELEKHNKKKLKQFLGSEIWVVERHSRTIKNNGEKLNTQIWYPWKLQCMNSRIL